MTASIGFTLGLVIRLLQYMKGKGRGEGIVPNFVIGAGYAAIIAALGLIFSLPLLVFDLNMGLSGIGLAIVAAIGEFIMFVLGSLSVDLAEWIMDAWED